MSLREGLRNQLSEMVKSENVVLFMKGTRGAPQCGFSATVVSILDDLLPTYRTVDVLSDPELRDGIKEFSSWPTIPQLYVAGQFVGGCDIVKEMYAAGDLQKLLGVSGDADAKAPSITVTETAAKAFNDATADADGEVLHLEVSPKFQYGLFFGPRAKDEIEVKTSSGVTILLDRASARRADGIKIDFVTVKDGSGGFKIDNPNEPPRVKPLAARDLKAMRDRGELIELFDVRTDAERELAKIEGARHLTKEGQAYLEGLPKDATLVFHCHHGVRSQAAAEHYLASGFKNVYNLTGGIDAWSTTVDPSVPRY